jgi:hypothetical protein
LGRDAFRQHAPGEPRADDQKIKFLHYKAISRMSF